MISKLLKLFKKYWWVLLLALITFIAYGQTLNMYFWVDDWGMAIKMQHPEANIPNFGPGIAGDGAYRWNVAPFIFLYKLFYLNAVPYFAIGLLFYFLASLMVYYLALELSKKKSVALVSALIFASGYIGSDAMNHLNNSYQLVQTGGLMALVVLLLLKHNQTGFKRFYVLAFLVYTAILEFLFLRSHGLILLIFFTSSLSMVLYKLRLVPDILKSLPFMFVWFYMFFLDSRMNKNYDGLGREDLLPNLFKLLFKERHFELFNNLVITISSAIFPDQVLFSIYRTITIEFKAQPFLALALPILVAFSLLLYLCVKQKLPKKVLAFASLFLCAQFSYLVWSDTQESAVWSPDKAQLFISSCFFSFIVILCSLYFLPKLRKRLYLAYFGVAWVISNVLIYFIYSPTTNLASNTRYLIPAFVGTALLFGSIFSLFPKKKLFLICVPILIYCSTLISLTNERATYIVENISIPAREHLKIIKQTVKSMDDKTVFYFEAANESKYRISELGGIPHFAIPVILDYKGIAKTALSYNEVFYMLKNGTATLDNTYTFFGKGESISNSTQEFIDLLTSTSEKIDIPNWSVNTGILDPDCCSSSSVLQTSEGGTVGVNPIFFSDIDYPSLTPVELTLILKVDLLSEEVKPPFEDKTDKYMEIMDLKTLSKEVISKDSIVDLQVYRQHIQNEKERLLFYSQAEVATNSYENTRNVEQAMDRKEFTSWESNSVKWRRGDRPVEVSIKFKEPTTISNLTWMNYTRKDTPTTYQISTSIDGISWQVVKEVKDGGVRGDGEIIVDAFPPVRTKHLKVSIFETYGGKTSAPAITEVWAGQTTPVTDNEKRFLLDACPLCNIRKPNDSILIRDLYKDVAKIKLSWQTNKNSSFDPEDYETIQIVPDGNYHEYKVFLPAQGTRIKKIRITGPVYPSKISIKSAKIKSLNLDEISQENLIVDFVNNP